MVTLSIDSPCSWFDTVTLPRSYGATRASEKSKHGELFLATFDLATPRRRRAAYQQGYWAVLSLIIASYVEWSYNRRRCPFVICYRVLDGS